MVILKKIYTFLMPAIFGAYAVLALYSYNVQAVRFGDIAWILAVAVGCGLGLIGLFFLLFRDISKASLVATCWMIVLFSYGQVYDVVHKSLGAGWGRNVILLPLALVLLVFSVVWVWKLVRDASRPLVFFGWMVAVLCLMTGYSLVRYAISINQGKVSQPVAVAQAAQPGDGPDIYYIILDAHGRQDILQELYGYDDAEFIRFLQEKGFFVADAGHSNYAQTELSLSSSLNMQYLDTLGLPEGSASAGRTWLDGQIKDSRVRQILAQQGYRMVSFSNGYHTAPEDADIYYDFGTTSSAADVKKLMGPSEVEQMFLASTLGRVVIDLGWLPRITNNQEQYKFHYLQTEYIFDKLPGVAALPGKYFVFAHVIVPHPPFVFSPDGSFMNNPFPFSIADGSDYLGSTQQYISGYRDQVEYVDKVMEQVISGILSASTTPPIIIIQGDHGPGAYLDWNSVEKTNLDERMSILNAYYFPGGHSGALYAGITPVNSFRVLLDEYFGMTYPLLEDRSYFSTWKNPFDYIDVTGRLKQ